tara:strand:+ start:432 stop:593 length:162 start_codon:yes stop_codon:yes gene_type:complete
MSIFNSPEFDSILAGIVYDSRVQSPDDDWEDDGQPTYQQEVEALEEEDYCGID